MKFFPALFSFRRLLPLSALLVCLSAAQGSTPPDLTGFKARFINDAKASSPALDKYLKEFAATVEHEWFTILQESGARPPLGTEVTMHFTLNADGEVDIVGVDDAGSGKVGVWACADALQRQQPYAKWSNEMIAAAGRNQTLSFTFYHR